MRSETGFDPALLERFPTSGPRPDDELEDLKRIWCAPRGWGLLTVVNNNYVGMFYVGAAFLFFLLAGVLALVMRVQLALPLQGGSANPAPADPRLRWSTRRSPSP